MTLQPLFHVCVPRSSVFDQTLADTVYDLNNLREIDATAFFAENYVTAGMKQLLSEGFKRLAGTSQSASGSFLLSQSMGGGKTHNLLALGLLALYPDMRPDAMGDFAPPGTLGTVNVVAFSGRKMNLSFGLWGEIAEQLHKKPLQGHFAITALSFSLIAEEGSMIAEHTRAEPGVIARCSETLDALHGRIAHRFARTEVRERVRRYLAGLLDHVERKNGWQLAEATGEFGAKGVQRLLNAASWDADAVRDDLREYVVEYLGDSDGVLIVDETGFLKKGTKSCGVARQYTGTAGDTVNCQVGVFLAYASHKGAGFIDRALYLPREWTKDQNRRAEAGIPTGVHFASKITLAEQMLERAFDADVPARWVVADSFYGRSGPFRHWLEEHNQPYAVMLPRTNAIEYRGRRIRVEQLAKQLPARDSSPWLCLALSEGDAAGMGRWLLVRRDADDPGDDAYWLAYGPQATSEEELVRVCDVRWQIEECFAQAKGEVGMDHYEVRTWTAWHRFVTLCMVAHAYLVVVRHAGHCEEVREKGAMIPV